MVNHFKISCICFTWKIPLSMTFWAIAGPRMSKCSDMPSVDLPWATVLESRLKTHLERRKRTFISYDGVNRCFNNETEAIWFQTINSGTSWASIFIFDKLLRNDCFKLSWKKLINYHKWLCLLTFYFELVGFRIYSKMDSEKKFVIGNYVTASPYHSEAGQMWCASGGVTHSTLERSFIISIF